MVQALRLNTLSKLTFSDSKRFDALIKDVFPDIAFHDVEYATVKEALKSSMEEMGLVASTVQVFLAFCFVLTRLSVTWVVFATCHYHGFGIINKLLVCVPVCAQSELNI